MVDGIVTLLMMRCFFSVKVLIFLLFLNKKKHVGTH